MGGAGLIKRSITMDPDLLAWLRERGARLDRSVNWQIRDLVRAAREREEGGLTEEMIARAIAIPRTHPREGAS